VPGLVVDGVAVVPAVPDWPADPAAVPVPAWGTANPAVTSRAAGMSS